MTTAVQAKNLVTISFKDKPGKITLRNHTNIKGDDYMLVNKKGESVSYTLDRTQQFDLSKEFDAQIVEGFRNHPVFGKALVIKSRTDEAKKTVATYDLMEAAGTFIKKMGNGVGSFARVLGVHVNGLDSIEIKARLLEIAMKDPSRILNLKDDPNFPLRVLLIEGLSVNVFTRREGIYMYGTTSLGSTEPLALEWLSKNTDLTPALRKEVDGKLK